MLSHRSFPCVFLSLFIFISVEARATSSVAQVGGASINKGVLSTEFRVGYSEADAGNRNGHRLQLREHADYGFTDWYALRVIVAQDKQRGTNFEHNAVTIENRFQLIERRDHGWDGGVRLSYGHRDGDKTPHEIDFRFLAQVPFGRDDTWEFRHNAVVDHDIGENSRHGVMLELRHQVSKRIEAPRYVDSMRVGVEHLSGFGRLRDADGFNSQNHQIGAMVNAKMAKDYAMQAGYRAGVSESAPNHVFSLSIGKNF